VRCKTLGIVRTNKAGFKRKEKNEGEMKGKKRGKKGEKGKKGKESFHIAFTSHHTYIPT